MSFRIYRQFAAYPAWGHSTGNNQWDENDSKPVAYALGVVTTAVGRMLTDAQSAVGGLKNWSPHQFDGTNEGSVISFGT